MKDKLTPRSEQKRAAIIAAAKMLFLREGMRAVSMERISEQAGVSKITLYKHFNNKDDLFCHILKSHWQDQLARYPVSLANELPLKTALAHFAQQFTQFLYDKDTGDMFRTIINAAVDFPELNQQLLIDGRAPFTHELVRYLSQQQQFKISDPVMVATQFIGMIKEYHFWQMIMGFAPAKKPQNLANIIDSAIDIICQRYAT